MNNPSGAIVAGLVACIGLFGQSQHTVDVCGLSAVLNVTDCYFLDTSTIGGLKFEDYKVANPAAVQFDPAQRLHELAALGPTITDALCQSPAAFTSPPPTITFNSSNVVAQIYWKAPANIFNPSEFIDVQFSNFTASNGYTSPSFGFRMVRQENSDGTEVPQYKITIQPGNPGLENVAGLASLGGGGVGYEIDPVLGTAAFAGTAPAPGLLGEAIFGVFANAQSILSAAKFSVTNPPPAGQTLWTAPEITSLAGQAQPWIAAAPADMVPLGPAFICHPGASGYGPCDGQGQLDAFSNMILTWGGEYLGLRTKRSYDILVNNLHVWATANAPSVDPSWAVSNPSSFAQAKWGIAKPILMLWPTLRADPALSLRPASHRELDRQFAGACDSDSRLFPE